MNLAQVFRTSSLMLNRQLARNYAFKSDLKIKWVRPEKIPSIDPIKSGDCSKSPQVSNNTLIRGFEKSKELETADAVVKRFFELGNNPNYYTTDYCREQLVREVQRHPLDYCSMEARLATMTAVIRRHQEYMAKNPRNKRRKVILKEMIEKRKKFLKYLRRWDYRCFEWILEKLDLIYKPPPAKFHWITRKESLQKLTDIHCDKVKQEKLAEYRKNLEEQQIPFLEDAIRKMEFIRQEQIDLDIPVTVTLEDINEYKKQLEELKLFRKEVEVASKKDDLLNELL